MKKLVFSFLFFAVQHCFAQYNFEGSIRVTLKSGSAISSADVQVKNELVLIRQVENPIKKYSYFLVNLNTRVFQTVALKDTMVVIQYHLDSLLNFYETKNLKEGFQLNYALDLKETDKAVSDGAVKMTKALAEDNLRKVTAWLIDEYVPLNELTPLLRLLGNWNEAQSNSRRIVLQADVLNKVSKKESSAKAVYYKEKLPATLFDVPKNALLKDFSKLMQEQRNNKDLGSIIQTFGGF
jgi:hypothetical protein